MTDFLYILSTDYLKNYMHFDEHVQSYVCGYAAHSIRKRIQCVACQNMVVSNKGVDSNETYFDSMERGGLYLATKNSNSFTSIGVLYLNIIQVTKNLKKSYYQRLITKICCL